jgi:integrase
MVYSSPKTKLSKRTVEIAPATIVVLKAYRLAQKERRLRAGDLWDAASDLFFTNDLGGPLDGVVVTKGFQKLVANAGLGQLRFHDLRHSSATRLLAAGARMDEIRARMGHSSIMTTVNTYAHHTANGASVAEKMQTILTQAEVGQLLEAVSGTEYETLVWLALDTGARQGELLALQMGDIDLENGLVHIRRSVRRITGQGMVYSSPKTKLSKRTVEIAPATIVVLKAYRLAQKERRLRAGDLWDSEANLFFTNDLGGPLDGVGVTKGFQKLVANAGLGNLRFHDLRHSSATRLLAAGARMDEIRARMGHSSIMTTVNVYGHRSSDGGAVAEKMQGILVHPAANLDGWLANG